MEAKTNEEFFNVSALIDERFGKEGTASRAEAEEKAYAFYTGQIIEDARKKYPSATSCCYIAAPSIGGSTISKEHRHNDQSIIPRSFR